MLGLISPRVDAQAKVDGNNWGGYPQAEGRSAAIVSWPSANWPASKRLVNTNGLLGSVV
jgi:hypothetical protein